MSSFKRRNVLKAQKHGLTGGIGTPALTGIMQTKELKNPPEKLTILFQSGSIADAGCSYCANDTSGIGKGYVLQIIENQSVTQADIDWKYYNRDITINKNCSPEFPKYHVAVRKMADDYKTAFFPNQKIFAVVLELAPVNYCCQDGGHPSMTGGYVMKRSEKKPFYELCP
jgi:hypothetical protein